jgi:hypothetical protein
MMEAATTSETSVNFYQTTRRNNAEDSHLSTRRRENLKSHKLKNFTIKTNLNRTKNKCNFYLGCVILADNLPSD